MSSLSKRTFMPRAAQARERDIFSPMTIESGRYTENRDFELRTPALRLAALGGFFMIGLLSLVPGGYRPHIPYFTGQMEHALAYAVVAAITALSLPRQRPQSLAMAFAAGACMLEIAQLLTADRNPSFADALVGQPRSQHRRCARLADLDSDRGGAGAIAGADVLNPARPDFFSARYWCALRSLPRSSALSEKCLIGVRESFPQPDPGFPAEFRQLGAAHQLARRSIGLARIANDFAAEPDDVRDEGCQLENRQIRPRADIDVLVLGVDLHDVNEGIRAIVNKKTLLKTQKALESSGIRLIEEGEGAGPGLRLLRPL